MALLVYCSYSYSNETVYGTTDNAAQFGYNWVMTQILPQQLGLQVNSVIYQYTTLKDPNSDMLVHVQNENARGPGYIFRETDDWSGLAGNTINKAVPVGLIDISYWGDGSIVVEGEGEVTDAYVAYGYQYTPCEDPQSDPECPGYIDMTAPVSENVTVDDGSQYIQDELDRKANLKDQKEEEERLEKERVEKEKEEEIKESLEELLGSINTDLLNQHSRVLHNALVATNYLPRNYFEAIQGGYYPDAVMLKDKRLPDSKQGLRVGLASELKHKQLVDLQYGQPTKEEQ